MKNIESTTPKTKVELSAKWKGEVDELKQDNVDQLLEKCQSSKVSEKRQGFLGLHSHVLQNESFSPNLVRKIGTTLCEIFDKDLETLKGTRSLFLDVLNAFLIYHARKVEKCDLETIFSRLLQRVLTGFDHISPEIHSELDGSICAKLTKTFEILSELMTFDFCFFSILSYLRDNTQNPSSTSKKFILSILSSMLTHCNNRNCSKVGALTTNIKMEELQMLVQRILEWVSHVVESSDDMSDKCENVFCLFWEKMSTQMTYIWSLFGPNEQNMVMNILKNHLMKQLWCLEIVNSEEVRNEPNGKITLSISSAFQDNRIDMSYGGDELDSDDHLYTTILVELEMAETDPLNQMSDTYRTELIQKLEDLMHEATLDEQFAAVCHYLRDPSPSPIGRFKNFALVHLRYLICSFHKTSLDPDPEELERLLPKLLNCCGRINTSQKIRDKGRGILQIIFTKTTIFDQMSTDQQQQIRLVLRTRSIHLN